MNLSQRLQEQILAEDESAVETLEGVLETLGGPGSGWTASAGHVPGSQGGSTSSSGSAPVIAGSYKGPKAHVEVVHDPQSTHVAGQYQVIHRGTGNVIATHRDEEAAHAQARRVSGKDAMSNPLNTKLTKASDPFSKKSGTFVGKAFRRSQTQRLGSRLFGKKLRGLAEAKTPQAVVLYMSPAQNEKDFTCGGCLLATPDGMCAVLEPPDVNLETGACGLYVPGKPHEQELFLAVPAKTAGYEEDGPYTCGRCIHFISPSACEGVAGKISADGCCNAWEGA